MATANLASHFRWHGDAFTDSQLIDTITPRHGNTRTEAKRHRKEPAWDPEQAASRVGPLHTGPQEQE